MPGPADVRRRLEESLDVFRDTRIERRYWTELPDGLWEFVTDKLDALSRERPRFFERHDYSWALSSDAYNSPFEASLQWRLLNVLSDIPEDHPDLARAGNIVVRVVDNLSARAHVRRVDDLQVIVLPGGYLSMFKGFVRVWFKGRGLARPFSLAKASNYRTAAEHYLLAVEHRQPQLVMAAKAYLGNLLQLATNELPVMDSESIFDEEIIDRGSFGREFSQLAGSVDAFIVFHEAAHILRGHRADQPRVAEQEAITDQLSVSLSIIDNARDGGGSVIQGGTLFFCAELLRGLVVELLSRASDKLQSDSRLPGMEELMMRSQRFGEHVVGYLPHPVMRETLGEFARAMTLVFDTVRWAMLDSLESLHTIQLPGANDLRPLAEFLQAGGDERPASTWLWTPANGPRIPFA